MVVRRCLRQQLVRACVSVLAVLSRSLKRRTPQWKRRPKRRTSAGRFPKVQILSVPGSAALSRRVRSLRNIFVQKVGLFLPSCYAVPEVVVFVNALAFFI